MVERIADVADAAVPALRIAPVLPWTVPYTDWRGEREVRRIEPWTLWYGTDGRHPGPQWFLDAWDLDSGDMRSFALSGFEPGPAVPGQEGGGDAWDGR